MENVGSEMHTLTKEVRNDFHVLAHVLRMVFKNYDNCFLICMMDATDQ